MHGSTESMRGGRLQKGNAKCRIEMHYTDFFDNFALYIFHFTL